VGLYAFQQESQNVFFGRERMVDEMVRHLREQRLLWVLGASGSGKSSVVRAGLLSALKAGALPGSETWHYYRPIVPGSDPLAALTRLVQPSEVRQETSTQEQIARFGSDTEHLCRLVDDLHGTPTVTVIDQFEEVFTLCTDTEARQAFVDNLICLLHSSESKHIVILTMRADFESQVTLLPDLQRLFEQAQVRVVPMSAAELRQAIVKPADRVGLKFEDGVVDALIRDMLGEPAALPLLQFTLLKLWENRERNRITWEAYNRLGGGRLALARSADRFYEALIPEEQVTARRILLRMVRPGEGLEVTNNRIRREALYQAGEARDRVDRVLGRLVDEAHLVRLTEGDHPADAQVEVAHEALVRNWPRLVDWLDEERVSMRRRLRLTAASEQWDTLGRDPEALLRGALLEEALAYEDLGELEAAFVQASQDAEELARQEAEAARQRELEQAKALAQEQERRAEAEHRRAEAQSQAARRLRFLLIALGAMFVLTLIAGGLVIRQAQQGAELAAVAAQAVAAETRIAAEEGLVAARDAQATAVSKLATAEALGERSGAQATAEADLAAAEAQAEQALAAQAAAEAGQLTAVAERNAVQTRSFTLAQPTATPVPPTPTRTPIPSATPVPTATQTPVPTATSTPVPRDRFVIEYLECQTHRFGLGSVKGQVFDREGKIIQGAQVEIWLNGIPWESSANPATTNEDGWYEWVLSLDQTVEFYALYVDGRQVDIDPVGFEVPTVSGCFQYVNFRQQ
jgi:hypothetical protein